MKRVHTRQSSTETVVEWLDGAPDNDEPMLGLRLDSGSKESLTTQGGGHVVKTSFRTVSRACGHGASAEIEDPVAWQREIRKDRPLPGRD